MKTLMMIFVTMTAVSTLAFDLSQSECKSAQTTEWRAGAAEFIKDMENLFDSDCRVPEVKSCEVHLCDEMHSENCQTDYAEDIFAKELYSIQSRVLCCSRKFKNQGTIFNISSYFRAGEDFVVEYKGFNSSIEMGDKSFEEAAQVCK